MTEYFMADTAPGHVLETDPAVVAAILNRFVRQQRLAALWLDAGRARMAVHLDGVELEQGNLLLRIPAEGAGALDRCVGSAVCVMDLPDYSIRFACGEPGPAGADRTLVVRVPKQIYRLSRRSGFRVPVPEGGRLHIGPADGQDAQRVLDVLDVLDLSLGGVGVLAGGDQVTSGTLGDCELELPGGPRITADLRLCNCAPFMRLNGEQGVRLGLAFLGLRAATRSRIRRYLQGLESRQNS